MKPYKTRSRKTRVSSVFDLGMKIENAMGSVRVLRGSVAWNVVEFFRKNPDEELWTDDIRAKWATETSRVPQLLAGAVELGLLSKREEPRPPGHGGGVRLVYSAGPALQA